MQERAWDASPPYGQTESSFDETPSRRVHHSLGLSGSGCIVKKKRKLHFRRTALDPGVEVGGIGGLAVCVVNDRRLAPISVQNLHVSDSETGCSSWYRTSPGFRIFRYRAVTIWTASSLPREPAAAQQNKRSSFFREGKA